MLDELSRSNAVDKRWAEAMIAGAATLEDLERAAIGTADNRWRIPRFNGRGLRGRGASHGEHLIREPPSASRTDAQWGDVTTRGESTDSTLITTMSRSVS